MDLKPLNYSVLRKVLKVDKTLHSSVAKVFTKLDVNSSSQKNPLSPVLRHLTTFITPSAQY